MSDDNVYVLTEGLRPPPQRISRLSKGFTLPKPVLIKELLTGLAGAMVGAMVGAVVVLPLFGFSWFAVTTLAGAGLGVWVVRAQPRPGMNVAEYLRDKQRSRKAHQATPDGEVWILGYVPIPMHTELTQVRWVSRAVYVPRGTVDEAGGRIPVPGDSKAWKRSQRSADRTLARRARAERRENVTTVASETATPAGTVIALPPPHIDDRAAA